MIAECDEAVVTIRLVDGPRPVPHPQPRNCDDADGRLDVAQTGEWRATGAPRDQWRSIWASDNLEAEPLAAGGGTSGHVVKPAGASSDVVGT